MKKVALLCSIMAVFFISCETTPEVEEVEKEITLEESFLLIEQDIDYMQGSWKGGTFSSEWFGFRYTATQGMILTTETALKEINATQSMNFDGPNAELEDYKQMQIAYEVMARSGDGSTKLEVLSEKIFADDLTVEQYVEILTMELTVTHGRDVVFNDYTTRLLGDSYYLDLTAIINIEGKTVYQTILLSERGDRIATVLLEYKEKDKLEELLSGFSPF